MYILISPCILSSDLRADGITTDEDRGYFSKCIERCKTFGIEIITLPCPETKYLGFSRAPGSFLERLNTPEFFSLMEDLSKDVFEIVRERGEPPLLILGVNSSPTCGVTSTYYSNEKSFEPGMFFKKISELAPLVDVKAFAKYKIYFAAPLFSESERSFNLLLAEKLRENFFEVHLPQELDDTAEGRSFNREEVIYQKNVAALNDADIIIGVIDGSDADSGTSWEMGYATALKKRVIALRTDFRSYSEGELVNLMLEKDAEVVKSCDELLEVLVRKPCV